MPNREAIINSIPAKRTSRAIELLYDYVEGTVIPPTGTSGYKIGARFTLTNASAGQSIEWINQGTEASCLFVPVGPVYGYGVAHAGNILNTQTASAETTVSGPMFVNTDIAFAGHIKSNDTDYIKSIAIADDSNVLTITDSAADAVGANGYLYGVLRNKCEPGWDVFAAGTQACTAATTTAITATGVLATDVGLACYQITDDTDSIVKTVCTANTVTVTHDTTSSTGHTVGYCVLRPRGTFKPSHYIFAAGGPVTTTADAAGIATNDVTIAGALTTDICFAWIHTQGGTIEIARAQVAVAGTLTVQFSADPSTSSAFCYMLLRSY
jgi:hypothetical protein